MKRSIVISLLLVFGCVVAHGQRTSTWGQVGGSYITNQDVGFPLEKQYTLRIGMGIDFTPRWSIGMKANRIFYRGISREWDRMWLAGPFVRWGIAPSKRVRGYIESGVYLGNYCSCGSDSALIFRDPGILYFSLGAGLEIGVWRNWFLDLGYLTHNIINRPRPKFGYNVYFLGVIYRMGDTSWEPDIRFD